MSATATETRSPLVAVKAEFDLDRGVATLTVEGRTGMSREVATYAIAYPASDRRFRQQIGSVIADARQLTREGLAARGRQSGAGLFSVLGPPSPHIEYSHT